MVDSGSFSRVSLCVTIFVCSLGCISAAFGETGSASDAPAPVTASKASLSEQLEKQLRLALETEFQSQGMLTSEWRNDPLVREWGIEDIDIQIDDVSPGERLSIRVRLLGRRMDPDLVCLDALRAVVDEIGGPSDADVQRFVHRQWIFLPPKVVPAGFTGLEDNSSQQNADAWIDVRIVARVKNWSADFDDTSQCGAPLRRAR